MKASIGENYLLGVDGDGIVCKTLLDEKICTHTWLAAASTSFEGTVDFDAVAAGVSAQRQLDQEEGWNGLRVDVNEAATQFGGFIVPVLVA